MKMPSQDAARYRALRRMLVTPGLAGVISRIVIFDGCGPAEAIDNYVDERIKPEDKQLSE